MKTTGSRIVASFVFAVCVLAVADVWAGVRGRALVVDSPSRVKPGNLLLCHLAGTERRFETLVTGNVDDARFSPDGKQLVYGAGGMIKIMDLAGRSSRDLVACTTNLTFFNWGLNDKMYWSDGDGLRQIMCLDMKTGDKQVVHKGNAGRSTLSLDGRKAAWVKPPMCAIVGGKQYRVQGGCGGAVSPSGKYLTSNLTTTHKLMGIFSFDDNGPSEQPIAMVTALRDHAINGFHFSRTDDWVCYTVEAPKQAIPLSFIAYWRTDDHVEIGKYVVKDYFDESDFCPADAVLEKVSVCGEGPTLKPLEHEYIHVGQLRPLKVVGHYRGKDGQEYTPAVRTGLTWKADGARLAMDASGFKALAISDRMKVGVEFQGKTAAFDVTILPELTGDGFKAEFFGDAGFATNLLTRVDKRIDFRWEGSASPDPAVNGRKPWSARWTGSLDVPVDGEYTLGFQLGEGNDGQMTVADGEKKPKIGLWIDGQPVVWTKSGGYPWTQPRLTQPLTLKRGRVPIRVETVDVSGHPVVVRLTWSGPGIKRSLLGGGYIHSKAD